MGVIRTDLSIEAMVGFELEAAMGSLYEGRMLMKFGVLGLRTGGGCKSIRKTKTEKSVSC